VTALPRTVLDDPGEIAARVARNVVYCTRCKFQQAVNGAMCMETEWPRHCLATMSIDTPEERRARYSPRRNNAGSS
jgi:hypothetical protein